MVFKVVNKCPPEIDMSSLQKILRGCWRSYLFDQWYKNNKPRTMALILESYMLAVESYMNLRKASKDTRPLYSVFKGIEKIKETDKKIIRRERAAACSYLQW